MLDGIREDFLPIHKSKYQHFIKINSPKPIAPVTTVEARLRWSGGYKSAKNEKAMGITALAAVLQKYGNQDAYVNPEKMPIQI